MSDQPTDQPTSQITSEATDLGVAERLHPFSPLFVLVGVVIQQFPALMVLAFAGSVGKDDRVQLIMAGIAALLLTGYAVWYTLTFRFWRTADAIIVQEGLFDRTLRHVPLHRIQNVAFRQNPLHRLFKVVELQLESGAGLKPEARFMVLPKTRATELEHWVRTQRRSADLAATSDAAVAETTSPEAGQPIHRVPWQDLVRLGLISNRGMIVLGGGLYFLSQTGRFSDGAARQIPRTIANSIGLSHGPAFWLVSAALSLVLVIALVRLLSVALSLYQYWNFTLSAEPAGLRAEHGLATKLGGSSKLARLVSVIVQDGMLWRWFGRRAVHVVVPGAVSAGGQPGAGGSGPSGMRYLSPVATPAVADDLVARATGVDLRALTLQPLAPRALIRMVRWPLVFLAMAALLGLVLEHYLHRHIAAPRALVLTLWLGLYAAFGCYTVWDALGAVRTNGYRVLPEHWVIRTGYAAQHTQVVPLREIQVVSITQSPFDRKHRMASVRVDRQAGPVLQTPEARVDYLPAADALSLMRVLMRASATES